MLQQHSHLSRALAIVAVLSVGTLCTSALAGGPDFNGDGFADLAVGAGWDTVGGASAAGSLSVIYGSSAGLDTAKNQIWHMSRPGMPGPAQMNEHFGSTLAWGDFDDDGYDDLAAGISNRMVDGVAGAGAVCVLYGSNSGLRVNGVQLWHQAVAGISDAPELYEAFGAALASGDFDHDGHADLAIGVWEDLTVPFSREGAVAVLYGSSSGLKASGDQLLHQNSPGIADDAEPGDYFGSALAAGDFDGDGRDDLAVGVPGQTVNGQGSAGAVHVIYGSNSGLNGNGDDVWSQATAGIADGPEPGDGLGWSLGVGDFNGDGKGDLAAGVLYENVTDVIGDGDGAVHVLYGSSGGLKAAGSQFWHQNKSGIANAPESDEQFGHHLAAGDFDGDGRDDLAIAVEEGFTLEYTAEGAVHVLYGTGSGLKTGGAQFWHQDSAGVKGKRAEYERFGAALCAADFDDDGRDDLSIGVPGDSVKLLDDAVITGVSVSITGLTHTYPEDIDILLVCPGGQRVVLMSDAGGGFDVQAIGLTFGDSAPAQLPAGVQLTSGFFKPTNHPPGDGFPEPAPAPGGTSLSVFNGTSPIGQWRLFVFDDFGGADGGVIESWSISFTTLASGSNQQGLSMGINLGTTPYPSKITIDSSPFAGAVNVLYGTSSGLDAGGDQLWHRNLPGIKGACEWGDGLGSSM
jgi:subtilisin-like proprotein convertase family protein/disulfide bond formation protein DsbB